MCAKGLGAMAVFQSQIETKSSVFQDRFQKMESKVKDLKAHIEEIHRWGLDSSHRQLQKSNKLPVRLRIQKLLDSSSHFLEFSPLAAIKCIALKLLQQGLLQV